MGGEAGLNVARANVALTVLLDAEQQQGFPFTAAAVCGRWIMG